MLKHQTKRDTSEINSALAYKYWLARCFHDGSPEEDLFRAVCVNSAKLAVNGRGVGFSTTTIKTAQKRLTL